MIRCSMVTFHVRKVGEKPAPAAGYLGAGPSQYRKVVDVYPPASMAEAGFV
jgi:hypothetical protein